MENTEITNVAANANSNGNTNSNANVSNGNNNVPAEATRKRERGNFTGRRMNSFDQLDSSQFPKRREDYVPMWAQELKAEISLLAQGQQKLLDIISAEKDKPANTNNSDAVLKEIKVLEANMAQHFHQVLGNQSSAFQGLYNGLKDVHGMLQAAQKKISWLHPIQKIKALWAAHVQAVKQKKAEKLQQQLLKLRGEMAMNNYNK